MCLAIKPFGILHKGRERASIFGASNIGAGSWRVTSEKRATAEDSSGACGRNCVTGEKGDIGRRSKSTRSCVESENLSKRQTRNVWRANLLRSSRQRVSYWHRLRQM